MGEPSSNVMPMSDNGLIVSHQLAWGVTVCDVISAIGSHQTIVSYAGSCACF